VIPLKTPAVGTELVLDGKECIVVQSNAKIWCEQCALGPSACWPLRQVACTGVVFMPKLEYLKRQVRGES